MISRRKEYLVSYIDDVNQTDACNICVREPFSATKDKIISKTNILKNRISKNCYKIKKKTLLVDAAIPTSHVVENDDLIRSSLHSFDDQPALEIVNQSILDTFFSSQREWFKEGVHHRDNGLPAFEKKNKSCSRLQWFVDGYLHREGNKPAAREIFYGNSIRQTKAIEDAYFIKGEYKRHDGGPTTVQHGFFDEGFEELTEIWQDESGDIRSVNNQPAYKVSTKEPKQETFLPQKLAWCFEGRIHRIGGPAIILFNHEDSEKQVHFFFGNKINEEEKDKILSMTNKTSLDELSDEDLTIIRLMFDNGTHRI